ncbi:hypothetical protein HK101_007316 [Irineochytrium annulatum]|nr:hypothetical protein HK101_007316 [Irineochytrium annulatum]
MHPWGLLALCLSVNAVDAGGAGEILLSFDVDTSTFDNSTGAGGDSPAALICRMGINPGAFHLSQDFPLYPVAGSGGEEMDKINIAYLDATGTDAILFMTINYRRGLGAIQEPDFDQIASQLHDITKSGRRVILRVAPEMNDYVDTLPPNTQPAPLAFVQLWRQLHERISAKAKVDFAWAPKAGAGYPYGAALTTRTALNLTEFKALDTNGNGVLDAGDDPYAPYYPGDDVVDWVGLSFYWQGAIGADPTTNTACPADQNIVEDYITMQGVRYGIAVNQSVSINFYDVYSAKKNKPFMISETNAYYNIKSGSSGASQQAIAQSYYSQYLTNTTFLSMYPNLKLINLYEWVKQDQGLYWRDYRLTSNAMKDTFKADLDTFMNTHKGVYVQANLTKLPAAACTDTGPFGSSSAAFTTTSVGGVPTATGATLWPIATSSVFSSSSSSSAVSANYIAIGVSVGCTILLAAAAFAIILMRRSRSRRKEVALDVPPRGAALSAGGDGVGEAVELAEAGESATALKGGSLWAGLSAGAGAAAVGTRDAAALSAAVEDLASERISNPTEWSCDDVISFLDREGVGKEVSAAFLENEIDGASLFALTPDVLKEDLKLPTASIPPVMAAINRLKNDRHVSLWSVEEVSTWLRARGIDADVVARFRDHHVDGYTLLHLSLEELKKGLGIGSFGVRNSLMGAIRGLGGASGPSGSGAGSRSTLAAVTEERSGDGEEEAMPPPYT